METIKLARTDQKYLRFQGDLLGSESTRSHQGPAQNRYHNFTVYRAEKGGFVIHDEYRTRWQGERDELRAIICETPLDVATWLIERHGNFGKYLVDNIAKDYPEFEGTTCEDL